MNAKNVLRVQKILNELNESNCTEIDLQYFMSEDVNSFDELREAIDDGGGFDVEITYYSRAIEYLQRNDASLLESLGLASEMGFTLDNLSSEVLASLLATQNERQEFESLESELTDLFDTIESEEMEEEEEEEETED